MLRSGSGVGAPRPRRRSDRGLPKPIPFADALRIRRHGPRAAATAAALFALAPLAAFAHQGVFLAFLLAALANLRRSVAVETWRRHRLAALGCASLCAWALATLSFAPEPDILRAASRLVLVPLGLFLAVSLGALEDAPRAALAGCLVATVGATVACFAFQLVTEGWALRVWYALSTGEAGSVLPLPSSEAAPFIGGQTVANAIATGNVLLAGMVWPAAAWLWGGGFRWTAAAMAAAAFASIAALPHNAATAAMIAGGVCFALTLRWPRAAPVAAVAALILYVAVAPLASAHWFTIEKAREFWPSPPRTWEHRVGMWSYAAAEISSAGLLGAGYDASRALADRGDIIGDIASGASPDVAEMEAIRLHPHNAVLQIWLELGAPGVAALMLVLAGIGAAFLRARVPVPSRAGAAGALAAMSVPFLVGFGVWQGWWIATLGLVAASAVLTARPPQPASGR